jgi:20S proteasome subunit beta 1
VKRVELLLLLTSLKALALAMSRDGSSGGTIRLAIIQESGVERMFIPGDQLPRFWEGKEVIGGSTGAPKVTQTVHGVVPIEVE